LKQKSLSRKKRPPKQGNGKIGAPKGHPKYERPEPEPDKTVEHKQDTCPHCNRKLRAPYRIERRLVEEIPEPRPAKVTEHLIYHYQCPCCAKEITANHNLPKSCFGWNLQTHTVLLRFADRLPLRKVVEAINRQYLLNLTDSGVLAVTNRASKRLQKEFQQQVFDLRTNKIIYIDETEIKISRETRHIWVFVGEHQTIFVIRKSRSKKVLKEILEEHFPGIIVCDGWSAYSQYSKRLQRCWAHLLRESHELKEKYKDFETFHNNLKEIYKIIQQTRGKPPPPDKLPKLKQKLEQRMQDMVDAMDSHKHFVTLATKIRNGLPYWLTCITNPKVEPTNNKAERALRELIVQRKIIGCLRSQKGAKIMETIHTMLATWKQQNKPRETSYPVSRYLFSPSKTLKYQFSLLISACPL